MANICSVDHVVYVMDNSAEASAQLGQFYDLLKTYETKYAKDPEKSPLWHLLADLAGEENANAVGCRSELCAITRDEETQRIAICEATCWNPCISAWDEVFMHFEHLCHAWVASEPGCRVFQKRDDEGFFNDRTYVVFSDVDEGWEYGTEFSNPDEWKKALSEICETDFSDLALDIGEMLSMAQTIIQGKGFSFDIYEYEED